LRFLINLKENTLNYFVCQSVLKVNFGHKKDLKMYNVLENNVYNKDFVPLQNRVWWVPHDFIVYLDRRCFFLLERFFIIFFDKTQSFLYLIKLYLSNVFL
jgi:hypothetical protein